MSAVNLIRRAGYTGAADLPGREEIAAYLRNSPALIDAWQDYSDDQRVDRGWVLQQSEHGSSVYHQPDGKMVHFPDKAEACAEFILQYVASTMG
ncbi:MAG TPA: hypothetical protein VGU69_07550 [Rhizomicrobium sp.]|nr:hypothetical protein [Rhizomicrobium sp.]